MPPKNSPRRLAGLNQTKVNEPGHDRPGRSIMSALDIFQASETVSSYDTNGELRQPMFSIMRLANSLVFTFVAPCIWRSKS